ncbi:hypothetical protein J4233_05240 [Candidatus Pacearchaeota archaeon]|nr:hypothetical protein [Candidatus Pacearchaeota archaeon]
MPTRQQRHDIRDAMAQIESLDLAHETSETLRTRLSIIEGKLQVAGANLAGNLFLDFLALQRAVNGYISERSLTPQQESAVELPRAPQIELPAPDFTLPRRDYVGMSGNTKVHFVLEKDSLIISRMYSRQIILWWDFDEAGRITTVHAKPFDNREKVKVVEAFPKTDSPDWHFGNLFLEELPRECSILNPGFMAMPSAQQYAAIMRFGHGVAFDLLRHLDSGEIKDSFQLNGKQQQLREIVEDPTAIHLAHKISQITPSVNYQPPSNSAQVIYQPNIRYQEWLAAKSQSLSPHGQH